MTTLAADSYLGEPGTPGEGKALPPASPTSLELPQTTSRVFDGEALSRYPTPSNVDSWHFLHRGWAPVRLKIREALIANEVTPARVSKFDQCHDTIFIYKNEHSGEVVERGNYCSDRFCMVCGRARSARIARAIEEKIEGKWPLFITLTVRGKFGDKLTDQLNTLREGWKQLRRLPVWSGMRGGAAMIEVKWSTEKGGHWHPHLHIIADGKFVEQADLSRSWAACTNGSISVDIRRVREHAAAIAYVTKYAAKPMDSSFTDKVVKIQEAMTALKGVRLCSFFGDWYGTPINEEAEIEEAPVLCPWICLGTESEIRRKAATGCRDSKRVLEMVERGRNLRSILDIRSRGSPEMRESTPTLQTLA